MRWLRPHGLRQWLPTLLLLGLAGGLQGVAVPLLQRQAQADEQAALQLLQQRAAAMATADASPAWQAQLPAAQQRETRLADLLEAAVRSGVQVLAVEQASPLEPVPGVSQWRISVSARGAYPAVRRFIEQALSADSALALEHQTLQRAHADAAEVDARLQWSLLERSASVNDINNTLNNDINNANANASASASANPAGPASADTAPPRQAWRAPRAEAVAAWSAPQPAAAPAPARAAPLLAAVAPAPAAQPASPPPPSPRAPALAYELIGTVTDAAGAGALLAGAQHSLWVRAGDTVDSAWRVQRVEPGGVDFLWLPQRLPARLNYRTP